MNLVYCYSTKIRSDQNIGTWGIFLLHPWLFVFGLLILMEWKILYNLTNFPPIKILCMGIVFIMMQMDSMQSWYIQIIIYTYIYIRAQVMVKKNTHGNRIRKYMRYVTSRQNPFTGRHCYNVSMFAYCYTGNCA